jgi:hypothetical protein
MGRDGEHFGREETPVRDHDCQVEIPDRLQR